MVKAKLSNYKTDDIALEFVDVSRRFILRHEQRSSFQDWFVGLFRTRGRAEEFWALRDISFSVRRGEAMGLIGRNGAGKSTLLKLVTRIIEPTNGQIRINGRVHAMLELGAGFHPELSGRDNIYLSGSIYGFSRKQIADRFDQVVQFAELERFIDTPVKHYSSGMFMRLGFSLAIHMQPEILVIDEVLAVGDAAFQEKSYIALQSLKASGTTILFVSHNAEQVRGFCDRAALLQGGRLIDVGPATDVVDHYHRMLHHQVASASLIRVRPTDTAGAYIDSFAPGQDLGLDVLMRFPEEASPAHLSLTIDLYDRAGTNLFGSTCRLPENLPVPDRLEPDIRLVRSRIRHLPLAGGQVTIVATLQQVNGSEPEVVDRCEAQVEVVPRGPLTSRGLLELDHSWEWEPDQPHLVASSSPAPGSGKRRFR